MRRLRRALSLARAPEEEDVVPRLDAGVLGPGLAPPLNSRAPAALCPGLGSLSLVPKVGGAPQRVRLCLGSPDLARPERPRDAAVLDADELVSVEERVALRGALVPLPVVVADARGREENDGLDPEGVPDGVRENDPETLDVRPHDGVARR